ncbi:hypothetical protein L600_000200000090 [Isoptericola variabilis J7]|nr:hypothetical protein L600_000200000090 [Isoptericola variabilis J7]
MPPDAVEPVVCSARETMTVLVKLAWHAVQYQSGVGTGTSNPPYTTSGSDPMTSSWNVMPQMMRWVVPRVPHPGHAGRSRARCAATVWACMSSWHGAHIRCTSRTIWSSVRPPAVVVPRRTAPSSCACRSRTSTKLSHVAQRSSRRMAQPVTMRWPRMRRTCTSEASGPAPQSPGSRVCTGPSRNCSAIPSSTSRACSEGSHPEEPAYASAPSNRSAQTMGRSGPNSSSVTQLSPSLDPMSSTAATTPASPSTVTTTSPRCGPSAPPGSECSRERVAIATDSRSQSVDQCR